MSPASPGHVEVNLWRASLRPLLRSRSTPIIATPDGVSPGASLWARTRAWTRTFRELGLGSGDRVVIDGPPSPAWLAALFAAWWDGITAVPQPPGADASDTRDMLHARAVVGLASTRSSAGVIGVRDGLPVSERAVLADGGGVFSESACLLMRTSGTSGRPAWVGLSAENVLSVVTSHRRALHPPSGGQDRVMLSLLPWGHAFGLVIDILPGLFAGATVVRDPSAGRDPASIVRTASVWEADWASMVPLQVRRLAESTDGVEFLKSLGGGVVGGAPVSEDLLAVLGQTWLRAGYGQTEASPGITLGDAGEWPESGWLGTPLGCVVSIRRGRLCVEGLNVCDGHWSGDRYERLNAHRVLDTGDRVEEREKGYTFLGRSDDAFKLMNGRLVDAPRFERDLVRSLPGIAEAVVSSPDGRRLEVTLVASEPVLSVDEGIVRGCLGDLSRLMGRVFVRRAGAVIRTAKGGVDRRALQRGVGLAA